MNEDEKWMKIALKEAQKAENEGEVPVGSILVVNNQLFAQGFNRPIKNNDPTAHAEIQVIREAAFKKNNYRLVGSTLYVTLEPCLMCFGAIINSRIERLVFGAHDSKVSMSSIIQSNKKSFLINHKLIVKGGVLKNFFKSKR
jgi:tRNA(adenine34) deaminase